MRCLIIWGGLVVAGLLTFPAVGREPKGDEQERPTKADRQDGERSKGDKGHREDDHGQKARGKPQKQEMERRHAPGEEFRRLIADALFQRFDADKDDKLSRKEFGKLAQFVREQHQHVHHVGPPPRIAGRGPAGLPRGEMFGPRRPGFDGPPRGDGPRWRERKERRPEGGPPGRPGRPDRPPGRLPGSDGDRDRPV